MFDTEEFKRKIAYYYRIDEEYVSLFIKHFLGEYYEINLESIKYKDIYNMSERKKDIELICGCSKSAKIIGNKDSLFNNYIKIEFYNNCMVSNPLKTIINIRYDYSSPHTDFTVAILEFMDDHSIITSKIRGENIKRDDSSGKKYVSGYQLETVVNYYSVSDYNYFEEDDRKNERIFEEDNLRHLCFKPDQSITIKKSSKEGFSDNIAFLEFIAAREALDKKIEEGKNAVMIQQLVKGD